MKKFLTFEPTLGYKVTSFRLATGYSTDCISSFLSDVNKNKPATYEGCFTEAKEYLAKNSQTHTLLNELNN